MLARVLPILYQYIWAPRETHMFGEDQRDYLLDHSQSPYHRGHCPGCTHRSRLANPACGDEVELTLRIEGDRICAVWFTGRGCVVSQAAASILAEAVEGLTMSEASSIDDERMLALFRAPLTTGRRTCCLLALWTLHSALGEKACLSD